LKGNINDHQQTAREQILKEQGVLAVSTSANPVLGEHSSTGDTYWEGKEANRTFLIHPNSIDKKMKRRSARRRP